MGRLDEYRMLRERSRRFCETAEMQVERGYYDLAAFSLEQCLQLLLKACLLRLGVDYPRVHSVRRLLEVLAEVTGDEGLRIVLDDLSVELGSLEDAYISSRYLPRDYTRAEVERLRSAVRRVMGAVLGSCGGGEEEV